MRGYGQWLECCRIRAELGIAEWAFCLDLEVKLYESIISGDSLPDKDARVKIFENVHRNSYPNFEC